MGKKSKHLQHRQQPRHSNEELPSSAYDNPTSPSWDTDGESNAADLEQQSPASADLDEKGLRHALYQRAVQSPKGEIRYFQKFFLTYIGGRTPLRMREDFCGTALICAEWVRTDARRTAVGVDLDEDALSWGLQNNIRKVSGDASSRIYLFKQNVLHQLSKAGRFPPEGAEEEENDTCAELGSHSDVVCALNFSCCCLQNRKDLVSYFKVVLDSISSKGGIFVMDLYGGVSSEQSLRFRRRYDDFMYIWEQEEFDIIKRTTRISLHFQFNKTQKALRHAFTYNWRLWTIPEIRDCLDEAGFDSSHLWLCEMPDLTGKKELEVSEALEFEEMESFKQCDAWNAYIVGIRRPIKKA